MRLLLILLISVLAVYGEKEGCNSTTHEVECSTTEYSSYVECLRNREKRSLDCQNSCESGDCAQSQCDECNCDSCYGCSYTRNCNNCCSSCCQQSNACETHHCCHKVCHAKCSSSSCRSSCRRTCLKSVDSTKIIKTGVSSRNSSIINKNENAHNITTIIHLFNSINNTNVIDAPIKINTTNFNNFSLPSVLKSLSNSSTLRNYVISSSDSNQAITQPNCCTVLSPRQCVRQDTFPFMRCFHYRYKMCGHMCYSQVIHQYQPPSVPQPIRPAPICQGGTTCNRPIIQIPQPTPSCAYSPTWPYTTCGAPQQINCEGCYGHYFGEKRSECSPFCYDDGFGLGPYYRQGPFYQPAYSHVPPCYQMGTCGGFGGYSGFGGYGGFGGYPAYSGLGYGYGMGGFMPGASFGSPPVPSYGGYPLPIGLPYGKSAIYLPSPPIFSSNQIDQLGPQFNNSENVTLAGPVEEDEGISYNRVVYPYDPYMFKQAGFVNITRDPFIQAIIRPPVDYSDPRHAQITIEAGKDSTEKNSNT